MATTPINNLMHQITTQQNVMMELNLIPLSLSSIPKMRPKRLLEASKTGLVDVKGIELCRVIELLCSAVATIATGGLRWIVQSNIFMSKTVEFLLLFDSYFSHVMWDLLVNGVNGEVGFGSRGNCGILELLDEKKWDFAREEVVVTFIMFDYLMGGNQR
ncbi:hypothetical protein Tco_1197759 [Tanacetum coccineum]